MMKSRRGRHSSLTFARSRVVLLLGVMSLSTSLTPHASACPRPEQDNKSEVVRVEYDGDKDLTKITLNPMILVSRKFEELRLGAMTSYRGKVKIQPKEVALIFISLTTADANKYEAARRLTATADGQRLTLGEARWSKQAQNGLFVESMLAVIPFDTFLRISRAKELTMKLGFTEVKLSTDHITMLRAAASYMEP